MAKSIPLPDRIIRDVVSGRLGSDGQVTISDVVKRYGRTRFSTSYLRSVLKNGEKTSAPKAGKSRVFVTRTGRGTYSVTKQAIARFQKTYGV